MTRSRSTGSAVDGHARPSSGKPGRRIGAALLGLWLVVTPGARAAEAAPEAAPDAASSPVTSTEPRTRGDDVSPAQPESGAAAKGDSPDVFVPSEDISEDFAVSFPVDI
ncbi:MAG: hypothetical protein RIC56_22035 [Pseudomonadales bacterium]